MAYEKKIWRFYYSNEIENSWAGQYGAKGEKRAKRKKLTPEAMEKQNQINRENAMRRLMKRNFYARDWFCTLKYPKGTRLGMDKVREDIRNFLDKTRKKYKRRGKQFKFIYRIEIGKRGGIHIHIIINRIPDSDLLIASSWNCGTVNFQHIREQGGMRKLANYIVKKPTEEIYKQISMFSEKDQRKLIAYSSSRNLVRPKPEKKVYKRRTLRKEIEQGPTPAKGYYIDKDSVVFGVNPYTGMSYLHYTEYRIGYGEEDDDAGQYLYHE